MFYPLRKDMICPQMKSTTLKSLLRALKENTYLIQLPDEIKAPAKKALYRMLMVR
jgi:quinolinate synthase